MPAHFSGALLILALYPSIGFSQLNGVAEELYGFRVGQYRQVVLQELGQPAATQTLNDSAKLEFYYLVADSSTYVHFQYLPSRPKEIYAIQLSGHTSDRKFYGINLGENKSRIENLFGKPDTVMVQEFDGKKTVVWDYDHLNMSILLADERVESIRIWDVSTQQNSDYPKIEDLLSIIASKIKASIAEILSPGLEVVYCDKIITWKNSFYKDLYLQEESVFDFIVNDQYGLITLSRKKDLAYDVNLRVVPGVATYPVYKFFPESRIKEVVLIHQQGKYKIWEVRYNCK